MKTFVINLDKYIENFNYQKSFLEKVGLEVERFKGINALENEHLNYQEYINNLSLRFCPNSILGCGLSHLLLSKLINDREYDITLIMEDDAFPIYNKKEEFNYYLKKTINEVNIIDKEWDIIQLHSDAPFPTHETYFCHYLSGSTAAYLISNRGVKKMIKEKVVWHIDIHTSVNTKFKKYRSLYNLFYTKELESLNREKKSYFIIKLYDNILTPLIPLRGEKTWEDFLKFKLIKLSDDKDLCAYEIINQILSYYLFKFIYKSLKNNITSLKSI